MGLSARERREEAHHVSILQHMIFLRMKTVDDYDPGNVIGELEFLNELAHGLFPFKGRRERERGAAGGKKVPKIRE